MPLAPLYVDLDGTLIKSDLLWESFVGALRSDPFGALVAVFQLRNGRAALKRALAERWTLDPAALPYDEGLLQWLREQADAGRPLFLATAADERLAAGVAAHLGLFSGVIASDGRRNTKGLDKLAAIRAANPSGNFAYAGNGPEDLPIFEAAQSAVVVAAPQGVEQRAQAIGNVERSFGRPRQPAAWLRALRPHQWLKNLLVFVPVLTAFRISDPHADLAAMLAFVAFCLVASAGYVFNDLLDVSADRLHPRKRMRPFASGALSIPSGILAGAVLAIGGGVVAASVSTALLVWVVAYFLLTTAYSVRIKRIPIFDVFALAGLYTMRVAAGGAAAEVLLSFWLVAFSGFLFLALALIKRCAELVAQRDRSEATGSGRGYEVQDVSVLQPLGIGASCAAVLVLALYVQVPEVLARYASPYWLGGMLVSVFVWQAHLWLVTARGRMHDDPIVHAMRDPVSILLVVAAGVAYALAALPRFW